MSFASNLRDILDFRDIEIKELSSGTGISKNTIDNYLSGQKSLPNAENAVKIARFLGTTVEFLVTGRQDPAPSAADIWKPLIADLQRLSRPDYEAVRSIVRSLAGCRTDGAEPCAIQPSASGSS